MSLTRIPRRCRPLGQKNVQAGAPHAAVTEYELASQTAAALVRHLPQRKGIWFAEPATAPVAVVSDVNDWNYFAFTDTPQPDLEIPWCMDLGADAVDVDAVFSAPPDLPIAFRLHSAQFLSAYTPETGAACAPCTFLPREIMPYGPWTTLGPDAGARVFFRAPLVLHPTSVPADQLILLKLECACLGNAWPYQSPATVSFNVYLVGLTLRNKYPQPT